MKRTSLNAQCRELIGKNWSKSSLTREKLLSNIRDFTAFLGKAYGLERIDRLKPGHVRGYVDAMHAKGLAPATMADKMTAVRTVARAVGKKGIVEPGNRAYSIDRVRIAPQPVDREKLEEIRGKIDARAAQGDKAALMVRAADALRAAYGLRAKESLMSSAIVVKEGKEYLVVQGAKGGRPRELPVDSPAKAAAVALVRETARLVGSETGRIIPPDMTLRQAYDSQRNLWRSLGGTRKAGANLHGERHGHARDMRDEGASNAEIMTELGHSEDRSPAAYLGKAGK